MVRFEFGMWLLEANDIIYLHSSMVRFE